MELIEGVNARYCTKCGDESGLKHFSEFGKKKGGKYGLKSKCKNCISECNKKYREENKEYISERNKKYYEENKEKCLERKKKYKKENKEYILEYHKKYREENKENISECNKKYYEENKEYISERNKKYREENKEKCLEHGRKRRALKLSAIGSFTEKEFESTLEYFDYKCAYTGEEILDDLSNCHREHIVPLSKGGDNGIWNIVPSLDWVNTSKHNSDMKEWYRKQPYFSEERLSKIYEYMNLMEDLYLEREVI